MISTGGQFKVDSGSIHPTVPISYRVRQKVFHNIFAFVSLDSYTKMLVFGGTEDNGGWEPEPFIVDLTDASVTCESIPRPSAKFELEAAAFIGDTVIVCSGMKAFLNLDHTCYSYDKRSRSWVAVEHSRPDVALDGGIVFGPNDDWIVSSAGNNKFEEPYKLAKYFPGSGFVDYDVMPATLEGQFTDFVALDDERIFFLGLTRDESDDSLEAWIFDWPNKLWTKQDSPGTNREGYYPEIGLATASDGRKMLVLAGTLSQTSTLIYDLSSRRWRKGPDLPFPFEEGSHRKVQFQKRNTFVLVGAFSNKILEFRPGSSIGTERWIESEVEMPKKVSAHDAILVPDHFVDCF